MRVLFVCEGNTCRSPMLQFMFENFVKTQCSHIKGIENIQTSSAGLAEGGRRLSGECAEILQNHGIPFCERKSVCCDKKIIAGADLVFTMTYEQARFLQNKFGENNNIIPLYEICGKDIDDPFGKGRAAYADLYHSFSCMLSDILSFILKSNRY